MDPTLLLILGGFPVLLVVAFVFLWKTHLTQGEAWRSALIKQSERHEEEMARVSNSVTHSMDQAVRHLGQTVGGKPMAFAEKELALQERRLGIEEANAAVSQELKRAQAKRAIMVNQMRSNGRPQVREPNEN